MAEELTIAEKILNVQKGLVAPKNIWNKYGRFYYRSMESILEALKPLNDKNGLLLTITDEIELIGDRYYIKAVASVTDGKDTLTVSAYAREAENKKGMDSSQVTGATSSYARKYALNGLYLIDDTQDTDSEAYQEQQDNNNQSASQTEVGNLKKEMTAFSNLMQEHDKNVSVNQVQNKLGIKDVTQLSSDDIKKSIDQLKKWSKNYGG